jgi:hypothetical protein
MMETSAVISLIRNMHWIIGAADSLSSENTGAASSTSF